MIVFGGSDGHASFADVHVLNLRTSRRTACLIPETLTWTLLNTEVKHNRLSHTATQVGSYLFVIGGHNGQIYAQDVLLFNLGVSSEDLANDSHIAMGGQASQGSRPSWQRISCCIAARRPHLHLWRLQRRSRL